MSPRMSPPLFTHLYNCRPRSRYCDEPGKRGPAGKSGCGVSVPPSACPPTRLCVASG